jgi:hypothetical protein
LSAQPAFANASAGDYYLTAGSGLINRGMAIPGINDEYVGSAPDIGAFEFGARAKGISVSAGCIATDWTVAGPAICQLQGATNLLPPAWTNIGNATNAENPVLRLTDENPADDRRFYRLTRVRP